MAPTLLAGIPDLTICREEVFGPVTTLLTQRISIRRSPWRTPLPFGLTAAVFSTDERTDGGASPNWPPGW